MILDDIIELVEFSDLAKFALGVPSFTKTAFFFNIVQNAVDPPPPFVLNIAEQFFLWIS